MPYRRRTTFAVFALLFLTAAIQSNSIAQTQPKTAFVRLDRITGSHPITGGIEIRFGAALPQITALRDDVLRVRVGPAGQLPEDASWAVLPASRSSSVTVTPESNSTAFGFKTGKLQV